MEGKLMPGDHLDAWKLSVHAKCDIVRRYKAGERIIDIAARYDIGHNVVCYHARMRGLRRMAPRRHEIALRADERGCGP
jgi:hypothetical protein